MSCTAGHGAEQRVGSGPVSPDERRHVHCDDAGRASERYAFTAPTVVAGRSSGRVYQHLRGARMAVDLFGEAGGLQLSLLRAAAARILKPVAPPVVSVHKNRVELSARAADRVVCARPPGTAAGLYPGTSL